MAPEMALTIEILWAIAGVAVLAAIGGMALLVLAVVLMVWPKMSQGDEISVFPPGGMRSVQCPRCNAVQNVPHDQTTLEYWQVWCTCNDRHVA
jgi:hypothetical protein